jgi:hypothetical protein
VHCLGSAVLLLLDFSTPPAEARGRFALTAKLPDMPALFARAMQVHWLGPGLVVAFVLLITLRGTRRMAYKPLERRVRAPKLERYRGLIPRRHRDLEEI